MTIKGISQEETTLKQKIEEKLMLLKGMCGWTQIGIARRLGYKKDVFSQISSGFSNGSPQLLAGLELLVEITNTINRPVLKWPDEILKHAAERDAAAAGMSLEDFAMWCAIRYGHALVEEVKPTSPTTGLSSPSREAAIEKILQISKGYAQPKEKKARTSRVK